MEGEGGGRAGLIFLIRSQPSTPPDIPSGSYIFKTKPFLFQPRPPHPLHTSNLTPPPPPVPLSLPVTVKPVLTWRILSPGGVDPITVKDLCNFSPYKHIAGVKASGTGGGGGRGTGGTVLRLPRKTLSLNLLICINYATCWLLLVWSPFLFSFFNHFFVLFPSFVLSISDIRDLNALWVRQVVPVCTARVFIREWLTPELN